MTRHIKRRGTMRRAVPFKRLSILKLAFAPWTTWPKRPQHLGAERSGDTSPEASTPEPCQALARMGGLCISDVAVSIIWKGGHFLRMRICQRERALNFREIADFTGILGVPVEGSIELIRETPKCTELSAQSDSFMSRSCPNTRRELRKEAARSHGG